MSGLLAFRVEGPPKVEQVVIALGQALDTRQILDEGAALLFNRMRTRFLQEVDPNGVRWPPSKAAQRRAVSGRGGGTLFESGKLFYSLQLFAIDSNTRGIGTNTTNGLGFPYPKTHQFGLGQVQRQFLGFGADDITAMVQLVIRRVVEALT